MAWKKEEQDLVSTLPVFEVKRSKDHPGWLIVTCPREDCADVFLVRKSHWTRHLERGGTTITGRSCPYCFRASCMPKRT